MTIRVSGAAAAALLLVAVAVPVPAQPAPLSGRSGIVLAQAASPESEKPARRPRQKEGASKKEASPRQLATKERQRRCAAEWKAAKAAGKVEAGMKWPKFWSACNARLKGTAA